MNNKPNNTMNNKRPTPCGSAGLRHKMAQLERERDRARKKLKKIKLELKDASDFADLLYMIVSYYLGEYKEAAKQMVTMREALKGAHEAIALLNHLHCDGQSETANAALAKLQPFITP